MANWWEQDSIAAQTAIAGQPEATGDWWEQDAVSDPDAEKYTAMYQEIGARIDPADYGPMKDVLTQDEFGNVQADPAQYEQLPQEQREAVNERVVQANQGAGSLRQGYTQLFKDAKAGKAEGEMELLGIPAGSSNLWYGKVEDQASTRASLQAIGGLGQQIKETYQRYAGDGEAANETNRAGQAMRGSLEELGGSDMERNVRGASESTLKALYAGRAGGVPGIIMWATQGAYNDAKTEAVDSGMTESEATKYALGQGAIEGGVTALFQMMGFGGTEKLLAGSTKWQGVKAFVTGLLGEQAEEQTIAFAQMALQKLGDVDKSGLTPEQALQVASDTMIQTALGFGMAQGISSVAEFASKPWPSRKAAKDAGVDQFAKTAKERRELAEKVRKGVTAQQFTEQLKAAATSPDEADALLEIYKARASSAGETFDDYVGSRIARVEKTTRDATAKEMGRTIRQDRRGEIDFDTLKDEGLAIIRVFESQNASTLFHETAHLFERDLKGDDQTTARNWSGARQGKWTKRSREKFARGFERYGATGEAPTKPLQRVFEKYKEWLTDIYGAIKGTPIDVNISPEMRGVFDRLLTPSDMRTDAHTDGAQVTTDTALSPENSMRTMRTDSAPPAPDILSQDLADRFRGLANQTALPEARAANYEADVAMGFPERKTWADAEQRAAQRIQTDPTGELARVVQRIDQANATGGTINLEDMEDTALVNRLSDMLAKDLANPESRALHRKLRFAFRAARSDQARSLGYRDPLAVMDPEARKRKSITDAIAEPTPDEVKARKEARTPEQHAEVDRKMEERYTAAKERLDSLGVDINDIDSIIADPKKAAIVLNAFRQPHSFWDMLFEYRRNSILSGILTQATNLTGNLTFAPYKMTVERSAEAFVNLFARDKKAASFGEFKYLAAGVLPGIRRGIRNAMTSWSTEMPALAYELGRDGNFKIEGARGAIPGKFGRLVRTIGYRPLAAADEFATSITATMEVGARAYRAGKSIGLEGEELSTFIEQQIDDIGSVAWSDAIAAADQAAFRGHKGVVADAAVWAVDLFRKIPGARYVVPFRDTPASIFEEGLKRVPGLGAIIEYAEARKHGKNVIDSGMTPALARQLIAMGALAVIWDAVGGDDPWITGAGDQGDPRMRDVAQRARPPQSIRLGDQWYSYARIEPFATMIATTADMAKSAQDGKPLKAIPAFGNQIKNKLYLDSIGDTFDMVSKGLEGDYSGAEKWVTSFNAGWVPNLYRQTVSASEDEMPESRFWGKEGDRVKRFLKRNLQAAKFPFVETTPRYDIWGRPITYNEIGDSFATSFPLRLVFPSRAKDIDKIQQADLALIRWNEKNPDNQTVYSDVPKYVKLPDEFGKKTVTQYLTDEQHAQYAKLAGELAQGYVAQMEFDPIEPTAHQIRRIKTAISKARKAARAQLIPAWTFD